VETVAQPYSGWVAECLPKAFYPSQQAPTEPNKHSDAFVLRILGVSAIREIVGNVDIDSAIDSEKIPYQGFPAVAALGFLI